MKHVSTAIAIFIVVVTGASGQWVKQPNAPQGKVIAASFVNAGVGVAVGTNGKSMIWSTADSGKTWAEREADPYYYGSYGLHSIGLTRHGTGWTVGPLGVYRTTDFGQTWTNDSLALPDTLRNKDRIEQWSSAEPIWTTVEVFQDWAFISGCRNDHVVTCRRSTHIDSSWQTVPAISSGNCVVSFEPEKRGVHSAQSPEGIGFLSLNCDSLYVSRDSGHTWELRSRLFDYGYDICWMDFVDSLNGRGTSGHYTSDGGRTWKPFRDEAPSGCSSICYVDEQCGWISDGLAIWMTRDAGRTWEIQLDRERTFTFDIVDDTLIYSLGLACFWKADYRSLCDSITSSVNDAPIPPNNLSVVVLGTTLTIVGDVPYDAGPVELMITDLVGRMMLKRDVQRDADQESNSVDVADVPCGTYVVALSTALSASSKLIVICP